MTISQKSSAITNPSGGVQDRLLESGEQLFAERGFDGTSIRDLAGAAECNIASVNYYFGSKEKLYIEIWRRHLYLLRDTRVASIERVLSESAGNPNLEDLLKSFAHAFIGPLVDESGGPRLMKLMAREMLDPHLPVSMFAEDVIKPTLSALQNALTKACPELPESKVPLIVFSLIGQLMYTIKIKAMLGPVGHETLPRYELAEVIDHIVAFSAAGIRACTGEESV